MGERERDHIVEMALRCFSASHCGRIGAGLPEDVF